jgi:hypothetical protein
MYTGMKIFEFDKYFPNEDACKAKFREVREKEGMVAEPCRSIVCRKCGCTHHYWKTYRDMSQCAKCGHRRSLRAGTVMHASKLPFRYWFIAMHLLTGTKNSFSAAELKRQLGHKRYQPIWELLHKLRSSMGKRDDQYTICGNIEFDEGFFTTEIEESEKDKPLKAGAGSQRKSKVAVMAETKKPVIAPKKGQKPTKVSYIKMIMVEDLKADTIDEVAGKNIEPESTIISDASKSHTNFKTMFSEHKSQVIEPKNIGKVLPWVHIAIANSKSVIRNIHHGVKPEFLQNYLSEFCYKFNRRYFAEAMFDRLLITANCKSDFEHRTYRNVA